MKNDNKLGEKNLDYSYSPRDIFSVNYSIYYWKIIDFLAYNFEKIASNYENDISKEYEKETDIFETSKAQNILHIGCGAYPVTAMTLAKMDCKNIVAIDRNPRAVKMANKIISKKNIYDNIKIETGDGRFYPLDKFDAIIISSNSTPKIDILNHVFNKANQNCKIIVRELRGISKIVTKFINSFPNIKLVKKIINHSKADSKWESFYTIKKE